MSCRVGHRGGLDPALLWLWHRLAATAPSRPLAWEPPYAAEVALEKAKRQKKKKKKKKTLPITLSPSKITLGNVLVYLVCFHAQSPICCTALPWVCGLRAWLEEISLVCTGEEAP